MPLWLFTSRQRLAWRAASARALPRPGLGHVRNWALALCMAFLGLVTSAHSMEVIEPVRGSALPKQRAEQPALNEQESSVQEQALRQPVEYVPVNSNQKISASTSNQGFGHGLSQEEEMQALNLRLNTQKALRTMQAQKLAASRKQGKKAWRKNLESFLSEQRQIQARAHAQAKTAVKLPKAPQAQEKKRPENLEPVPSAPKRFESQPFDETMPQPELPGQGEPKPQRRQQAILAAQPIAKPSGG